MATNPMHILICCTEPERKALLPYNLSSSSYTANGKFMTITLHTDVTHCILFSSSYKYFPVLYHLLLAYRYSFWLVLRRTGRKKNAYT